MVERRCDEADRRIIRVYLTDLGRSVDAQMIARIRQGDVCALEGLSEEENMLLVTLLGRIRDNLIADMEKREGGKE